MKHWKLPEDWKERLVVPASCVYWIPMVIILLPIAFIVILCLAPFAEGDYDPTL
jgi:hypothetical protein